MPICKAVSSNSGHVLNCALQAVTLNKKSIHLQKQAICEWRIGVMLSRLFVPVCKTSAKVAFTHLLFCRGTVIHKHQRGDDIDQQSNYGQGVWSNPCRDLLDEPVPEELTRRLKQGPSRCAVFMLLQALQLSRCQRLRPQEMWHRFPT